MTYSLYSVLAVELQESIGVGFTERADQFYKVQAFAVVLLAAREGVALARAEFIDDLDHPRGGDGDFVFEAKTLLAAAEADDATLCIGDTARETGGVSLAGRSDA